MIVAAFTAGTTVVMWLGEKITEVGIGNGISMLIFAGIVANVPGAIQTLWNYMFGSNVGLAAGDRLFNSRILCIVAVLVILLVCLSVVFRMAGVWVSLMKSPLTAKERLFCMIAYAPKATVQASIGAIPLSMGLACGELVLTVAVLSILLTAPFGALGIDALHKRLLKTL